MSESSSSILPAAAGVATPDEMDRSCRLPLMVLFPSGALWLVIGSVFGLIASIKFHGPDFLADFSWLTYGRVYPAWLNAVVYGFCVQTGMGVALWLLARLGRVPLAAGGMVAVGAAFWNLGVTIGVLGILGGNSTGFEFFEMPSYAAALLFPGYLLMAVTGILTFHRRTERELYASQWFLLAGLFWFAWIFSTAWLLLGLFPQRGIVQAVIGWWYANNLLEVWMSLAGLGALFYFVPKLAGRPLRSHYLALFAFWTLILFNGWGGIASAAPVPAWMPALSTAAAAMSLIPLLGAGLNLLQTAGPPYADRRHGPAYRFVLIASVAFILAGLMRIGGVFLDKAQTLQFTWFGTGRAALQFYGFFAMALFGSVYAILPRVTGMEFPKPWLIRAHFCAALVGIVLLVLPLGIEGLIQAQRFEAADTAFVDMLKATLPFLRAATMGELLLFIGHLLFLANVAGLLVLFVRRSAGTAYSEATADLFKAAEVKS
jgi:cytochrome c oxidase cbb3-type subunit I